MDQIRVKNLLYGVKGEEISVKYLPILQELFESDTIVFLIIGIAIALVIGLRPGHSDKYIFGIVISAATYFICEFASNVHTNFMLEMVLLFAGTAAIGCCIGMMFCLLIQLSAGLRGR